MSSNFMYFPLLFSSLQSETTVVLLYVLYLCFWFSLRKEIIILASLQRRIIRLIGHFTRPKRQKRSDRNKHRIQQNKDVYTRKFRKWTDNSTKTRSLRNRKTGNYRLKVVFFFTTKSDRASDRFKAAETSPHALADADRFQKEGKLPQARWKGKEKVGKEPIFIRSVPEEDYSRLWTLLERKG